MIILGLTGGIASGKSTVSQFLQSLEIPLCDTDIVAREVVKKDSKGLKLIVEYFGKDVLLSDGTLNRAYLGEIIFKHETHRKALNAILHPLIFEAVEQFISQNKHYPLVVIDMPLLFETHYDTKVDEIMVVYVNHQTQINRLMKRNALTQQQANDRINAQMPLDEKVKKATVVIDNNGSIEETYEQVRQYLKRINYDIM